MKSIIKNLLDIASGKAENKQVEMLRKVVERNKIKNSGGSSIDKVIEFSDSINVEHKLYY